MPEATSFNESQAEEAPGPPRAERVPKHLIDGRPLKLKTHTSPQQAIGCSSANGLTVFCDEVKISQRERQRQFIAAFGRRLAASHVRALARLDHKMTLSRRLPPRKGITRKHLSTSLDRAPLPKWVDGLHPAPQSVCWTLDERGRTRVSIESMEERQPIYVHGSQGELGRDAG